MRREMDMRAINHASAEAFFGTIAIAIKWKRGKDGQKD